MVRGRGRGRLGARRRRRRRRPDADVRAAVVPLWFFPPSRLVSHRPARRLRRALRGDFLLPPRHALQERRPFRLHRRVPESADLTQAGRSVEDDVGEKFRRGFAQRARRIHPRRLRRRRRARARAAPLATLTHRALPTRAQDLDVARRRRGLLPRRQHSLLLLRRALRLHVERLLQRLQSDERRGGVERRQGWS
eukprot:31500-Pelagococcus_subviridis.AAC.6